MLGTLGILGFVLVLLSTRWGPAVSDDTFRYIASAQSLADGKGLGWPTPQGDIVPLTGYPPLVSWVLVPFLFVDIDALTAMRFLHASLFAVFIVLSGLLVTRTTRMAGFGLGVALLILVSDVFLEVFSAAMSEALYLTLSAAGMYFLVSYTQESKQLRLIAAACATGLAFLTRYVGLALVLALVIGLLLHSQRNLRRKLRDATLFLAITTIPMAAWIVRNTAMAGVPAGRELSWYGVRPSVFAQGLRTFMLWFVPGRLIQAREALAFGILLVLLLLIGIRLVALRRRSGPVFDTSTAKLLSIMLFGLILLTVTIYLITGLLLPTPVPLDKRIMAPVHAAVLILLSLGLAGIWRMASRIGRILVVAFSLLFFLFYAYRAFQSVQYMHREGFGYTSRGWHSSEAIEFVRQNMELPIYSNAATAIYLWTGRVTNPLLPMLQMQPHFKEKCAVAIIFNAIPLSLYPVTHEELSSELISRVLKDGLLYLDANCIDALNSFPMLRSFRSKAGMATFPSLQECCKTPEQ